MLQQLYVDGGVPDVMIVFAPPAQLNKAGDTVVAVAICNRGFRPNLSVVHRFIQQFRHIPINYEIVNGGLRILVALPVSSTEHCSIRAQELANILMFRLHTTRITCIELTALPEMRRVCGRRAAAVQHAA